MAGTRLLSAYAFLGFLLLAAPVLYRTVQTPRAALPAADDVAALCAAPFPRSQHRDAATSRRLLPMQPSSVHVMFALAHGGEPDTTWQFERDVGRHLEPLLAALRRVVDVRVSSQQLLYATLGQPAPVASAGTPPGGASDSDSDSPHGYEVHHRQLAGVVAANDWTLGDALDDTHATVVTMVAFVPDARHRPLHVRKPGPGAPSTQFAVAGFGGFVVVNPSAPPSPASSGHADVNWRDVAAGFAAHLRRFFGLPAHANMTAAQLIDVTAAEQQPVASAWLAEHVHGACRSLSATLQLADSMPHMQVSEGVGHAAHRAVQLLQLVVDAGSPDARLRAARQARQVAEEAGRDPAMVPQLYFPMEHLAAVYLPLWAPLVLPLGISVVRATREWLRKRRGRPASNHT